MTLTIAPSRGRASAWAGAGLLLLLLGIWLALDSGGHVVTLIALPVFAVVAAWFLLPAVVPAFATLHLDERGMTGRALWRRIDVSWDDVVVLRIDRASGERVLDIQVAHAPESILIPLPIGADLVALDRFLSDRLGRGDASRADAGVAEGLA